MRMQLYLRFHPRIVRKQHTISEPSHIFISANRVRLMEDDGAAGNRWYVVTVGQEIGVFRNWPNVGPLVLGHAQSVYQRVESRADGIVLFNEAIDNGAVRLL
jgi:hypothetical protein